MKHIVIILLALLTSCIYGPDSSFGTRRVALQDCDSRIHEWMASAPELLGRLGGPRFQLVSGASGAEYVVRCSDTGPSGGAEEWRSDAPALVRIDPSKFSDGFGARNAFEHGLIHAEVFTHSSQPIRVRFHVCPRPGTPRSDCYAGAYDPHAMMTPGTRDDGPNASLNEVSTQEVAQDEPQDSDRRLFRWAMGLSAN